MLTAALQGQVRSEADRPMPEVAVELRLLVGGRQDTIPPRRARSDSKGAYRFERVPPGAYAVILRREGWVPEHLTLWVDDEARAPLRRLARGVRVAGRVVDDRGRPMARAVVRAIPSAELGGVEASTTTDVDGRFSIDGLRRGIHQIQAAAESHLGASEPEVEAPAADVKLRLTRLYQVEGHVAGRRQVTIQIAGSGIWPGRRVRAAADGSFRFDRVPAGVYELVAQTVDAPWAASEIMSEVQVGPDPPSPVKLRLVSAQRVIGVVRSEGRPIPGAIVTLGRGSLTVLQNRATTDGKGEFALDPTVEGDYQVGVWVKGFMPVVAQKIQIPVPLPFILSLNRGSAVSGLVVDADGQPVAGAMVWVAYRIEKGDKDSAARAEAFGELGVMPGPVPPIPSASTVVRDPTELSPTMSMGFSDRGGSFVLRGLQPGNAQIVADHPSYTQARSAWIQLGGADRDRTPLRLVLRPGTQITGRVLDERGIGLDGAQVVGTCAVVDPRVTLTDRSGHYAIAGLSGRVTIAASRRGYMTATRTLAVAGRPRTELDLVLEPATGGISGSVLNASRLPVDRALVTALSGGHRVTARTDSTGFFELRGTGRTSLTLRVTHPSYAPYAQIVAADARAVDIQLRPLASLAGRVEEARTAAPIKEFSLQAEGGGVQRRARVKDAQGRFTLAGLVAGTVKLRVDAAGYAIATTTLKVADPERGVRATDAVVTLTRAGALEGQVTDLATMQGVEGATVSTAGLRATTTAGGAFKIERVPEGSHVVEVRGRDGRTIRSDAVAVRPDQTSGPLRLILH
jgi:hypothetical protein